MIFFERKISLFIFVTQDVKNNIPICICRICLLRIIFKFVFIHQKKYSLQSGWKKVTVWTSDGRRCWTECQMEWGAGLNVWLREVTVWKLDGSRCWTEGRMEGGAGLKVGWISCILSGSQVLHCLTGRIETSNWASSKHSHSLALLCLLRSRARTRASVDNIFLFLKN